MWITFESITTMWLGRNFVMELVELTERNLKNFTIFSSLFFHQYKIQSFNIICNNFLNFSPAIYRKFCCLPIFRILGRLTYGAYLVHVFIARMVIATLRDPIYFGTGTMVSTDIYKYHVGFLQNICMLCIFAVCLYHVRYDQCICGIIRFELFT